MNVHLPAPHRKWPGRLVNLAVVVLVLALAAATFVLSYSGVHAIAVQAGVPARLARLYPGVFDAVFVIACVAAVVLRDARWWARLYSWLVIIAIVAVVGATDAVHAMNVVLPHRETEGVVAAVPWVLVLLGFSLMLTMLRQSRSQHATVAAPGRIDPPAAAGHTAAAGQTASEEPPTAVGQLASIMDASLEPEPILAWEEPVVREPALAQPLAAETAATRKEPLPDDNVPVGAGTAHQDESGTASGEAPEAPGTPGKEPAAVSGDAATVAQDQATNSQEEAIVAGALAAAPHDYWGAGESDPGERGSPAPVPEVDQDAPPFATAPFATVPRLNRVRATPIPPEEDDKED